MMPVGPTWRACPRGDHGSAELCPCSPPGSGRTPAESPCTRLSGTGQQASPHVPAHLHDASRHREGLIIVFSSKKGVELEILENSEFRLEALGTGAAPGGSQVMGGRACRGRQSGLHRQCRLTTKHQPCPRASLCSCF